MPVILLYWFATSRRQKMGNFTQNLVRNAVGLVLVPKTNRKRHKTCKNQTMFEKLKYPYFAVYGLIHRSKIYPNNWNNVFPSLFEFCHYFAVYALIHESQIYGNNENNLLPLLFESQLPSVAKWSPLKVFSRVTYF